jgi:mono/diheme cytochrome c family protein
MRRPFALGSAASVLLVLIIALALTTPTTQGQSTGPFAYIALADAKTQGAPGAVPSGFDSAILANAQRMVDEGRRIFRFDTFGDEAFWGGQLRLHEALATVTPRAALGLGLKVDADALPADLVNQLKAGQVNLDDPAVTANLLKLNAVVGVTGFFNDQGGLQSVGIQCALCHSTVDDSLSAGIGRRLDGWPARDLDVGKIIALAPTLKPFSDLLGVDEATVRQVLNSWGPGKFDAELILDGKAFRPDGKPAATLNPPAFGLAGVNNHTWTGAWGTVSYWNAFVANLEMHGQGTFFDPRLNDPAQFPVAAKAGLGNKKDAQDLITAKLPSLHFYQLAIPAPKAPAGTFDAAAAGRGEAIFNRTGSCATCHVPPIFTEPGWNLHTAAEIGIDDFQSQRSPDKRYRTAPLRALWDAQKIHKGGFYHDGRFPTLLDVVNHYNNFLKLGLTDGEKADLIEYLKSI